MNVEEALVRALAPLRAVADAYYADGLDEARPEWEEGLEHDAKVELLSGRGGRTLLTLGQALEARRVLLAWENSSKTTVKTTGKERLAGGR